MPVAGRDLQSHAPLSDVELRAGVVAVDDAVAVGDVHPVLGDVALLLLVAGEQVRDVRLVLDQHHLRQPPDGGVGRFEFPRSAIGAVYLADLLDVLPG